ncbi:fucolectin-like [Rhopilema esculentum]|uniref:fucolectin-like n=1 Tax=Rhopilema esculentum TaxID=499914 RepID=UPI0031D3395D|eukprot:gene4280-20476_t
MEVNGIERLLYIIAISFFPVQSATYFELIKGADTSSNEKADNPLVNKRFFQCDRNEDCKYIVKMHGSNELKIVPEEHVLASPGNFYKIWKKVQIVKKKSSPVVKNIALYKPVVQSSQYDQYTPATNAVDGSLEAVHRTCAITTHQSFPPWFRVDLQQKLPVRSVALQNRRDCCWNRMNPFDVRVGMSLENDGRVNPKCVNGGSFTQINQYLSLGCPSVMYGRYVIVLAELSSMIEICELEVYS